MIDIASHPVWRNVHPLKRYGHRLRIFMARQYAKAYPRSLFIGITGSVGKTSTANACEAVLSSGFRVLCTQPNLDPIFNIPITLMRITPKTKKVILEMAVEYPGEMDFYLSMVRPATAIVTRIYYQHSEFLGGLEEIANEKGKLIGQLPSSGFAILNWDDPIVRKLADKTEAQVIFYGRDPSKCHVWAGNIKIINFQTRFELNCGVERVEVNSKLLGFHQIYPLLAAGALGITAGIPLIRIKKGLEKVEPEEHRMQLLAGFNDSLIIDDSYNAAPVAVEEALETLNFIPARRRIIVLGEMKELGKFSEKMHRAIGAKIFKDKIDLVLLGGGDAQFINDELQKLGFNAERIFANMQNPQMVNKLLKILNKGDVVLIKGARSVRLDEVAKRISRSKK